MNWCKDCAIRLFNTKHYNLQGIGNPWDGKCIVVPNVDYIAYKHGDMTFSNQVKIIEDILLSSTGVVDSNLYIIPLIRCNEHISCGLDTESYKKCINYFAKDVKDYNFKDILLLGCAGSRFLSIDVSYNLDNIFVSSNNRRYAVNYSPLIKYVDDTKFDVFTKYLQKWYNSTIFNNFDNYNIIKLN